MEAKRQWEDIFKVLKEKTVSQELYIQQSYPSNIKENSKDICMSMFKQYYS